MHYRTIVVSDIHLGSLDAKYEQICDFLEHNTCDHLIMNGDIIDGRYLRVFWRWPHEQSKFFDLLRKRLEEGKTKISYLYGNHDSFWQGFLPIEINGISLEEHLILTSGSKKYIVCHGHQFDHKSQNTRVERIGFIGGTFLFRVNRIYNRRREKKGRKYHSLIRDIKRIAKILMTGGRKTFEKRVTKLIKKYETDGCICGHLHRPEISTINGFDYMNSGDRVESYSALVENEKNERALVYRNKK